ncbi:Methyl-accepting chemotaxis protein [Yersinia bercovieri ATCC 43970]|uniref:Methyl-accepting chemotaxis protein n=2 Tax=Yersinia bercovieri TaxID=634 RepID=A0ABM9XVT0_YERBE|nr:Methyl-accepting chemotaxis protein [Yersinia bercovieri ATCC 43970]
MAAISKVYNQASKVKSGFGTGMVGTQSTKDWAAVTAAQMKQMNSVGKSQSEAARQAKEAALADKKRLAYRKALKEATDRDITATMKLKNMALDIGRMDKLSAGEKLKAVQAAKALSQQYREQRLDMKELNFEAKRLLQTTKAIARSEAQARKQPRQPAVGAKGGRFGLAAGTGIASIGAMVGGFAAYSAAESSTDRAMLIKQMQKQDVESFEAQALVRYAKKNNITKDPIDLLKDINEKKSELQLMGKVNPRTGEIQSGGEMVDLYEKLLKPTGVTMDQIKNWSPTELMVQVVDSGRQLKKTNAEMTYFLESIDEGSLFMDAFKDQGKLLVGTWEDMDRKGQLLTSSEVEQLVKLREFGQAVGQAGQTLGDRFSIALASAVGGSEGVGKSLKDLTPLIEALGTAVGKLTLLISWIVSKLPFLKTQEEIRADSLKNHEENLTKGGIRQWIAEVGRDGMKAYQPYANSLSPQAMIPTASSLQPTPYQASSQYQAPVNHITVKPADVHISTDVGRLEGVFSVLADNKIASFEERQMNDLMTSFSAR